MTGNRAVFDLLGSFGNWDQYRGGPECLGGIILVMAKNLSKADNSESHSQSSI